MNEDKYLKAKNVIENLNIWIDNRHLLISVVTMAERLEKEVLMMHEAAEKKLKYEKAIRSALFDAEQQGENLLFEPWASLIKSLED